MTDRDPQIQEVIRAIKSLEGQIPGVIRAVESGQKWQRIISLATLASVLIAVIAFALSVWVNYGSAKREADVAASEALMRHYQFAAQHQESNMVPDHAIYTANIIVDLTDAPTEEGSWPIQSAVERMRRGHATGLPQVLKITALRKRSGLP